MRLGRCLWILLFGALIATSCTRDRTQIMLRIRTDMTQGPSGQLGSFRLRVMSEEQGEPDHDEVYELGSGTTLPATLGLVPTEKRDGRVDVEIEARAPNGEVLFIKRAWAHYVPERTLLLEVDLAARCREANAQACPEGQSCGLSGCEKDERDPLPEFVEGGDASLPQPGDDGGPMIDACLVSCDGACVDTNNDVAHCGECNNECAAPENATPTCSDGSCGFECEDGYHACDEACVSNTSLDSCGSSCTPCPTTANGVATCDGTACGFVCEPGFQRSAEGCIPGPDVEAPRPVAPLSFGRVTSLRPTFRWVLAPETEGALVQVCKDRNCANVLAMQEATGGATSLRLDRELELPASGSRRVFFRLFGRSGDATGSTPSPTWSFVLPARDAAHSTSFGAVYDFNGDGLADLAAGSEGNSVQLYRGTTSGLMSVSSPLTQGAGSQFGVSIAAAGDVDGDGYGDLVVGAPGNRTVYIYRGTSSGVSSTPIALMGPVNSDFGRAVAGAGDVNGDGYADVLVGAPTAGRAFLYYGGASMDATADVTFSGGPTSRFGAAVASLGDGNADGFSDIAIGAPDEGRVYVFRGGPSLPANITAVSASATLTDSMTEGFGATLAGGLDIDGDGRSDLLVGSPDAARGEPAVRLYLGASGGVGTSPARQWAFPGAGSGPTGFGSALHSAGDIDGDGFDDWVVGAPEVATAYIFRGQAPDGEASPARTYSFGLSSRFGAAVTSTGDIDGDGYDDTIIGAPGLQSITVYFHSASGPASSGTSLSGSSTGFGAALACLWPASATSG